MAAGTPQRTQELIDRFETLSTSPTYRRSYFPPVPYKKDKSPIRQSFKNFITVLRKVGKRNDRLAIPASPVPAPPVHRRMHSDTSILTTLTPGHKKESDTLLYLTRSAGVSPDTIGPLSWAACTVTLEAEDKKLLVSTFSPALELCIHEIILSHCTDIRSLSPNQLVREEASLLRKLPDSENIRVFQLVFEGRATEKFVARSVRERAGWISAIWAAILPDKDAVPIPPTNQSALSSIPVRSPIPLALQQISPLLTPTYSGRSLPPLPDDAPRVLSNLHIPVDKIKRPDLLSLNGLISPSIYPPSSRPTSSLGVHTPRASSPSIANLTQLSVVRQRLSQIERRHSELSVKTGGGQVTPTRLSPVALSKSNNFFPNVVDPSPGFPGQDRPFLIPETSFTREARVNSTFQPTASRDEVGSSEALATKSDLDGLSSAVSEIQNVLGGQSGYPTIHQMVLGLDHRIKDEGQTLNGIQSAMKDLVDRFSSTTMGTAANETGNVNSNAEVMRTLREIRAQLDDAFSGVTEKLTTLRCDDTVTAITRQRGLDDELKDGDEPHRKALDVGDLERVLQKLEEIRDVCVTNNASSSFSASAAGQVGSPVSNPEHTERILSLLTEDNEKHSVLLHHQADSVRYLNELNGWLEAFVNNGTSQIQTLAANVDQLCKELGVGIPRTDSDHENDPTRVEGTSNLLNDIRQLALGIQARDQNFTELQSAVQGLLEVLMATQTQRGSDSQAVANLIDRQTRDQQALFRAFTSEISEEVKGQRLRFVEAMKEATAINVQLHVEQFKQELNREVMAITEEVGRLRQEKQTIENQISELFTFYSSRQPKSENQMPFQPISNVPMPSSLTPGGLATQVQLTRSAKRPLPFPKQL